MSNRSCDWLGRDISVWHRFFTDSFVQSPTFQFRNSAEKVRQHLLHDKERFFRVLEQPNDGEVLLCVLLGRVQRAQAVVLRAVALGAAKVALRKKNLNLENV